MKNSALVTVCTQVYNSKPYLVKCISSVLTQTYTNFEYIIIDNGSTDGSEDILKDYAEKDTRIRLIRFEENKPSGRWIPIAIKEGKGKYLTSLDSDDWWEPTYLEQLLDFLEKNNLDLAITGTMAYYESSHASEIMRQLEEPVVFTRTEFAQYYPQFWTYPSTLWASLMKMSIFRKADFDNLLKESYNYGLDTMCMLKYIEKCSNLGIDNSALQHYRIHSKSFSYGYNFRRFDSNVAYYKQIKDFLEKNKAFDHPKQEWIKKVHLASMNATLSVLKKSALCKQEKLEECSRIISHPLTSIVLANHCDEREQWFTNIEEILRDCFMAGEELDISSLKAAVKILAPRCSDILHPDNVSLFSKEPALCKLLLRDDFDRIRSLVLDMVSKQQHTKQYDLGKLLQSLTPERSLAHQVEDVRFIRKYRTIYENLCREEFIPVLDEMTELLLENEKIYNEEFFLSIYISAAALVEQVPAFLFGKTCLARMYFRQQRNADCQAVLKELDEMGVESEEIEQLKVHLY